MIRLSACVVILLLSFVCSHGCSSFECSTFCTVLSLPCHVLASTCICGDIGGFNQKHACMDFASAVVCISCRMYCNRWLLVIGNEPLRICALWCMLCRGAFPCGAPRKFCSTIHMPGSSSCEEECGVVLGARHGRACYGELVSTEQCFWDQGMLSGLMFHSHTAGCPVYYIGYVSALGLALAVVERSLSYMWCWCA